MDIFLRSKRETNHSIDMKIGLGLLLFWTILGAFHTSLSSVLLSLEGIDTNWFHLSLNYFSRTWIWVLLTPLIYKLYVRLVNSNKKGYYIIIFSLIIGVIVSVLHVAVSIIFDIFLRSSLKIIDVNFWDIVVTEIPFIVKSLYRSYFTYAFLLAIFICNDHLGVIKKFIVNVPKKESINDDYSSSEPPIIETAKSLSLSKTKTSAYLLEKLIVKSEGKIRFLQPDQIRYIQSKGNYVLIKLSDESIIVRMTLKALKSQLSHVKFFRISRSVIINQDYIKELEPWFNREYFVRMTQGEKFKTGRAYKQQIHLLLNIKDT